jgi:hypothetical protein
MMRRRLLLACVALAWWVGASWAAVNGEDYHWWRVALILLFVVTLALLFVDAPRLPRRAAAVGGVAALAAVLVATQAGVARDVLACVFFAGVLAVELALIPART